MTIRRRLLTVISAATILLLSACSGGNREQSNEAERGEAQQSGLSEFELEHGIGPVTEVVELGELDENLALEGKNLFEANCSACHKPTERYIGPAVGDVLDRRSPAYVMNMIMNPDEMTKRHPEGKKLLQEYMAPMPYQNVTVEEVRAIVEYFRTIDMQ